MTRSISTNSILILISFYAFFLLGASSLAQNSCDDVLGEWFSPDKDGKFLFYKSNGSYFGKLIWLSEPKDKNGNLKVDKANPDPTKRNDPMMGVVVFKDFKWDPEEHEWVDGTVYDARYGDTYSCKIKLSSNLVMEVRGYILFSWLGKSAYFTRY
jgi:uncharacterized protein (DUF2147 family)